MWKQNQFSYPNLWIEGKEEIFGKNTICIAGSREPLQEGALGESFDLGNVLAKDKTTVLVSGLARGVDICSLKGFFLGKREIGEEHTPHLIGCIGTSPDQVYPKENDKLQSFLKDNHLLLSLVRPEERTSKYHFLERNRLMARISNTIYIMSCTETSGCHSLLDEGLRLKKTIIMSEDNVNLSWVRKHVSNHEKTQGDLNFRVLSNKNMIEIAKEKQNGV